MCVDIINGTMFLRNYPHLSDPSLDILVDNLSESLLFFRWKAIERQGLQSSTKKGTYSSCRSPSI